MQVYRYKEKIDVEKIEKKEIRKKKIKRILRHFKAEHVKKKKKSYLQSMQNKKIGDDLRHCLQEEEKKNCEL